MTKYQTNGKTYYIKVSPMGEGIATSVFGADGTDIPNAGVIVPDADACGFRDMSAEALQVTKCHLVERSKYPRPTR